MGTQKSKIKSKEYAEIKWILFSAVLITIFINPKFTDPFNAPKMHLLILSSIVLMTYLFFEGFFKFKKSSHSTFTILILIFLLILIAQVIFTDMFYTAVFGESLRQLGVLSYFGFTIYMAATYKYFKYESKRLLNISILLLGHFYVLYGILQFTGNDPFNWVNQYNPIIGTLGNPNYSSALMAILATLSFSFIFDKEISKFLRLVSVFNTILLFVVIILSPPLFSASAPPRLSPIFVIGLLPYSFLTFSTSFLESLNLFVNLPRPKATAVLVPQSPNLRVPTLTIYGFFLLSKNTFLSAFETLSISS
jgi:hypothetical protein